MKYHYDNIKMDKSSYGEKYVCDHKVYSECTLFIINGLGLAVIQQRYDPNLKITWWGEIDDCLKDSIYLNPKFYRFFKMYAGKCENGLYPTVTVRQIMWALRMKPLKKEPWETVFDHKPV